MLFLGSLDDKTVEYPNGALGSSGVSFTRLLLNHILFSDKPIVLEEGFILASKEALNPGVMKPVLIPAIRSGLIRVISRNQDIGGYVNERRKMQHKAPPDTPQGRKYIKDLQDACNNKEKIYRGSAYLKYPKADIDEATYHRFRQMSEGDEIRGLLNSLNMELPKYFLDEYEKTYRFGNNGGQWTARAAWEDVATRFFGYRTPMASFLMVKANRERQIIRAAATSYRNSNMQM